MRAVLTYHSIDDSGSPVSLSAAVFRTHLDWLTRGSVAVLPLAQLLEDKRGRDAVALTFDDAFTNIKEPVGELIARGLSATLFVVSKHAGHRNDWGGKRAPGIPHLPLLDWDELGTLAARGVSIGAHSRSHPMLSALTDEAIEEEVGGGADDIEQRLGQRPTDFAYPYGDLDDRVTAAASRHFARACTTDLRTLSGGEAANLIPRLDMYYFRRPGAIEAWGTAAFDRYVAWCRFKRAVRRLVYRRQ
jgi:peptidoglycan/xylan/chitin deacetylase (PgdA/CDA1 family)